MARKSESGFSLLEAIVAIAILALSGGALLGWINTMLVSVGRLEAQAERDFAIQQSIAVLSTINPMTDPSGNRRLGRFDMLWQASEVEPATDGVNRFGLKGLYRVGLYNMEIELKKDGDLFTEFAVRHVGYQQVRQPDV